MKAQRRVYLGRLGVRAVRVELAELVWVRMVLEPEAQPERMDVELLEPQVERRLARQESGLKERPASAPVSAVRLARKRRVLVAFESAELGTEQLAEQRAQQAWLPLAGQELRAQGRGPERQAQRKAAQRRPEEQQASDEQLLQRPREPVSQTLRRTRRLRQLALAPEWRRELFRQHRPVSSWSESFSP